MEKFEIRLRILILEDSPSDAKLVQSALRMDGIQFDSRVVDNRNDFINGLREFKPHIILSDHSLPGFNSMEALSITKAEGIEIPFILVTGTVSEEFAVSVIKAGATDYILKHNLNRLTIAILSALSQKQDRDKLRASEEQFQHTIDGMVDGVQIIGYDWKYLYVNNIVAEQSRFTREELIGRTMTEIYPGIEDTVMYAELKRCMEDRIHVQMENEFTYHDGTKAWFKLTMQPVSPGVLILSRDITDQKNIIQLLETQNKRITMVNAALDRFLYSVSHEFRAPICNGLGLINLLRMKSTKEDKDDILNKLESSIRSLDELLQNIGVFSDVTGHDAKNTIVNLRTVIAEIAEQRKALDGGSDVNVSIQVEDDTPFMTDKKRLSVVMSNLISNAIKYRDPRKKSFVEIIARVTPKAAHLEVRDNGLGIREEYMDKIFDVFYTSGDLAKGRGLGLFMAREIVEKLGGDFSVKSQHETGTTFYVTIPNGGINPSTVSGSKRRMIS